MLELTKQKCKMVHAHPRAELHGEETKLAVDLKFQVSMSNDVLSEFDPKLKGALYGKGDSPQGELIQDKSHLPKLKFPNMGAIKWGYESDGYELIVHYGIDGKSDIKLSDCGIDNFRFDCQEGGTVLMTFRVISHPNPNSTECGRLCDMISHMVDITLTPPAEEEQKQVA